MLFFVHATLTAIARILLDYQAIFAVLLAVVGWGVTHLLMLRSQNRAFLNQVENQARLDLTSSMRVCQDYLGVLRSLVWSIEMRLNPDILFLGHQDQRDELGKLLLDRGTFTWAQSLEEYEILFPETRESRISLMERMSAILKVARELHDKLVVPSSNEFERFEAIKDLKSRLDPMTFDLLGLIEDLRIYLQNATLSRITGNQAHRRQPPDSSVVRLVMIDGQLREHRGAGPLHVHAAA